jgi:DNA-binding CsgD family transcriptional regulator
MFSEDLVFELVDLIYEAAGDPRLWPEFLKRLADATRAQTAQIGLLDAQPTSHQFVHAVGLDPSSVRDYNAYYSQRDVWLLRAPKNYWTTGFVGMSHHICSGEELERTEFYHDFLRRLPMYYGMTGVISKNDAQFSVISITRDKSKGPYRSRAPETRLIPKLMPHLQRAIALHQRIADLENNNNSIAEILDRLPIGSLLVGTKGKVLMLNRPARDLIDRRDGIRLENGSLCASLSTEDKRLQALIHGATATGALHGLHPGGVMTVSRRSLRRPFSVLVTPLRATRSWLGSELPRAAVFISDPECEIKRQDEVVAHLFGLTPAEGRLAVALMRGRSLRQAAEELRVTRNTVRSQLQTIFAKTETNTQSSLLRLLLRSPALIQQH